MSVGCEATCTPNHYPLFILPLSLQEYWAYAKHVVVIIVARLMTVKYEFL